MNFSIVQKSQLEGAHRLDAEFYQPEYLKINKTLWDLKSVLLREVITRPVVTGSTPKARDCKGDGTDIKFVKTDVVRDGEINFDFTDSLPIKASRRNSEPKEGDILVTIIGATYEIVGRTARVFADDPRMNINQNIVLIRPKNIILSSYLETFLRSKFGRDQLWQQSRQTEQVNLNCREVENVKIPILDMKFQNDIDELVNHAHELKLESAEIYKYAENLLLEELGLKDFQKTENLSFVVNLSDVKTARRTDAEYFQPKYEKLILKIKTETAKLLPEVIDDVAAKFNPQSRPDETFHYVELANVNLSTGVIDGSSEILGKEAPSRAKRLLKTGDVIASSVEGSLGKVALASEEQNGYLASTGFFQFRSKLILPEVLLVLGKSIVLQMQLEKQCTGTILTAVPQDSLKNILIPILPIETQRKIAGLVRQSHDARRKSKALLEQAKKEVEEMIEKTI